MSEASSVQLSILIPVYNELENLELLHQKLTASLEAINQTYEVILTDDGSTDGSTELIREICKKDARFALVRLNRNFGQTAAMAAGIDHARGKILVTMDADLQNDPADIVRLLERFNEGYDLVSGWRRKRKDAWINRTLPSKLANVMISRITGVWLHDYGCTLKAYRADLLKQINLYGEMHRFLPALLSHLGARITEIEVTHHPRHAGKTKYGIGRTGKVLLDLLTVKFLGTFATKPIYLFGWCAIFCFVAGALSLTAMLYLKYLGFSMILTPLPMMTAMLEILGVQFLGMGLLAELVIRTYHESQHKKIYVLREFIGPGSSCPQLEPQAEQDD
ncbi:glycosyltransferase family 2 protein [bacterium]|nr:glycosyltransferase family 2 protein [bacterium]